MTETGCYVVCDQGGWHGTRAGFVTHTGDAAAQFSLQEHVAVMGSVCPWV